MAMAFHTTRGLKIRLELGAIQQVLDESGVALDLDDAFADVELWANLPNAMCAVAGIIAAVSTQSVAWTLGSGVAAFAVGNMIQQFVYSPFLRVLFPQLLGSWLIVVPGAIVSAGFLFWSGNWGTATTLLTLVLCNVTRIADLLLLPLMPIRIALRGMGVTRPIGDMEFAFISILNHHASRQQRILNWVTYFQQYDLPA